MAHLDVLTPTMLDGIQPHVAEWTRRCLHPTIDRDRFTAAADHLYRHAGRTPPPVVWSPSPFTTVLAAATAGFAYNRRNPPKTSRVGLGNHVFDEARWRIEGKLSEQLGITAYRLSRDLVLAPLTQAVSVAVADRVTDAVTATADHAATAIRAAGEPIDITWFGDAMTTRTLWTAITGWSLRTAITGWSLWAVPTTAVPTPPDGVGLLLTQTALAALGSTSPHDVDDLTTLITLGLRNQVPPLSVAGPSTFPLNQFVDTLTQAARGRVDAGHWQPWCAWVTFLRTVCGLHLTPHEARLCDALVTTMTTAAGWWPHPAFSLADEPPTTLHLEPSPTPDVAPHQLHHPTGASISWGDGWRLHHWHGVHVPPWVITDPTVARIRDERSMQVRRAAMDRLGWDRYAAEAGLTVVGVADDPGNPGRQLILYRLPDLGRPLGLLLVTNGTPEPDGHHRVYGLLVPGNLADPVTAAAWTVGETTNEYAATVRRT